MPANTVRYVVPCLDGWLNGWEDFWYLTERFEHLRARDEGRPILLDGALRHWRELRPTLLQLHGMTGIEERSQVMDSFLPPQSLIRRPGWLNRFSRLMLYPQQLAEWCWRSRRVYRIDSDLQSVLGATSLEGVSWKDITPPFDCFAIELDRPLIHPQLPGEEFEFVMVDCLFGSFGLSLFSNGYRKYVPLTPFAKSRLSGRHEARRTSMLLANLTALFQVVSVKLPSVVEDERVLDTAERWEQDTRAHCENDPELSFLVRAAPVEASVALISQLCRIVAGFCLYLKSLPPTSRHVSAFRTPNRSGRPDRKAITDGAQVCTVGSIYTLSEEERVLMGAKGSTAERARYELSWHFREGHWRRAPGRGNDANAPRTVHVRPTIVRKDRRPEDGGLPAGAEKVH